MKVSRKWFILISLVLVFSLVLAACGGGEEPADTGVDDEATDDEASEPSEAAAAGDLIIAMPSEIASLDPHGSNDNPSSIVTANIYDNLVVHDANMELQPELAESYERIDDTTWEFKLREGVTFHDGEAFNAEVVKANLDRVLDPDLASQRAFLFTMIEEVEVVDEYTVRIITEFPFAPLPFHLAHTGGGMISPAAIEADYAGETDIDTNPVGTGPFKFERWDEGSEVVLVKNDQYWGDEVNLDSVTYKFVSEELTRIGMLENNEAHIVQQIDPANANRVENIDGAHLVNEPSLSMTYVGFNTQKEPFNDVRVRQAITMAIDTELINEGIYQGYGTPAKGSINDLVFGYNEELEALPYDVERARELLAEAGYEDGFSTTLWTNDNPVRIQTAEYIQDQLGELGINVEVQEVEWTAYLEATAEGEHDMFVLGWVTVTGDADYGTYALFHTDNFGAPGNRTFYSNETVDELLDQARRESDVEERERLYHEVQEYLIDEAPMIYTVFDEYRVGVSDRVEGFVQHPNGLLLIDDVTLTGEDTGY